MSQKGKEKIVIYFEQKELYNAEKEQLLWKPIAENSTEKYCATERVCANGGKFKRKQFKDVSLVFSTDLIRLKVHFKMATAQRAAHVIRDPRRAIIYRYEHSPISPFEVTRWHTFKTIETCNRSARWRKRQNIAVEVLFSVDPESDRSNDRLNCTFVDADNHCLLY